MHLHGWIHVFGIWMAELNKGNDIWLLMTHVHTKKIIKNIIVDNNIFLVYGLGTSLVS